MASGFQEGTRMESSEQNLYKVHIGQSPEELKAALGTPSKQESLGSTEKWYYDVYSSDNRQIYPYTATFENGRQTAVGMEHVLVNGTVVLQDGKRTAALPGRGLKSCG